MRRTKKRFNDSLGSLVTKMGQKAKERQYELNQTTSQQLDNAYDSSWIIRKYINKTIGDMTKGGREIFFDEAFNETDKKTFNDTHAKFETAGVIADALFNLLLYGDVLIFAVTDVSEEIYSNPLGANETLKRLIVLSKNEFKEIEKNTNFEPFTHYRINTLEVHKSRCVRLQQGIKSYGLKRRDSKSDASVALEVAKMFDTITMSVSDLIEECKLDIFGIEGYNDQISAGNDEAILRRLRLIQLGKSYTNAIAMDMNDKYETKETNLTGLADLWTKASIVVAGALNRPLNIIFGESASGFSSGEEDNRAYYETIAELQNTFLRPIYEFIDPFILKFMGKADDGALEFDFVSIDSVNEVERANILNTKAAAFGTLIDKAVITEAIALKELRDEGLIKNITNEDVSEAEILSRTLDDPTDNTLVSDE